MENAPSDAVIRGQSDWGQGEKGAAGYKDSGQSELTPPQEERHAEKPRIPDSDEQPRPAK
jgi:hypothetical protein